MLSEHQNLIAALRYNIQQLKSKYESEKREHELTLAELGRVSHELTTARGNIFQLQQQYDNLKMVEHSSLNEEERKNANKRLQRMMREIDKCMALLNE
jgi:chromosome segregation ATPase